MKNNNYQGSLQGQNEPPKQEEIAVNVSAVNSHSWLLQQEGKTQTDEGQRAVGVAVVSRCAAA